MNYNINRANYAGHIFPVTTRNLHLMDQYAGVVINTLT